MLGQHGRYRADVKGERNQSGVRAYCVESGPLRRVCGSYLSSLLRSPVAQAGGSRRDYFRSDCEERHPPTPSITTTRIWAGRGAGAARPFRGPARPGRIPGHGCRPHPQAAQAARPVGETALGAHDHAARPAVSPPAHPSALGPGCSQAAETIRADGPDPAAAALGAGHASRARAPAAASRAIRPLGACRSKHAARLEPLSGTGVRQLGGELRIHLRMVA